MSTREDELEQALRKIDKIRHDMKEARDRLKIKKLFELIDELKKPCMEIYQ